MGGRAGQSGRAGSVSFLVAGKEAADHAKGGCDKAEGDEGGEARGDGADGDDAEAGDNGEAGGARGRLGRRRQRGKRGGGAAGGKDGVGGEFGGRNVTNFGGDFGNGGLNVLRFYGREGLIGAIDPADIDGGGVRGPGDGGRYLKFRLGFACRPRAWRRLRIGMSMRFLAGKLGHKRMMYLFLPQSQ